MSPWLLRNAIKIEMLMLNNNEMLSLWEDVYSKFVMKILKDSYIDIPLVLVLVFVT